ncbi:MAG: hypothetical protein JWQ43_2943 [Glaciihabitans sp.]|nr:hypothetical protein [Glaciihabitans sp.]
MSDQRNDQDNPTTTTPAHSGATQHRSDDVVDTHRVVNDDDAGTYTDVDLAPDEVEDNVETGLVDDDPDGKYTDIDESGTGGTGR